MRNIILGGLLGGLTGLPSLATTPLDAQARGHLAAWSVPCFPVGECRDHDNWTGPHATPATLRVTQGPPALRRVDLWPHAVSAFSALLLASTLDNQIRSQVQEHRSDNSDGLARFAKRAGQPEVYVPVALGTVAVGMVAGDGRILRAGGRITGGLLLAGVATNLLKPLVGRARPRFSLEAHNFRPLSAQDSWPSGHTAMAFALATSVSDELRSTPATIALYGVATLTGWSRINDDRHWATDVAAGAIVGVVSAKLMNGRWRVFGVSGPRFLLEGDRVGMGLAF